jgi:hypothetical protein
MNLECPLCGHRMAVGRHVCRPCEDALTRDLDDVPSLTVHLDLAEARQTRMGDGGGGKSSEPGLAWDDRARCAQDHLRAVLAGWARVLQAGANRRYAGPTCLACTHRSCGYRDLARGPATPTVISMSYWLRRQRLALLRHPAADEALDQIRRAVRDARAAIDRPPGTWFAGPCGIPGEAGPCVADLYARHGEPLIICRACYGEHDAADRKAWLMDQVAGQVGTAAEVARGLHGFHPHLTQDMIYGWAKRWRITPVRHDHLGRPMYWYGDIDDYARDGTMRPLSGPVCASCRHPSCKAVRAREQQAHAEAS